MFFFQRTSEPDYEPDVTQAVPQIVKVYDGEVIPMPTLPLEEYKTPPPKGGFPDSTVKVITAIIAADKPMTTLRIMVLS